MKSFFLGFEKKAISASQVGVAAGAAPTALALKKIHDVNAKERNTPKTNSTDEFVSSLLPGDILYGASRGGSEDLLAKLLVTKPRRALFALGGNTDSHTMLYTGNGKAFHIGKPSHKKSTFRNVVNIKTFLEKSDPSKYHFIAYRPEGLNRKDRTEAVQSVKELEGSKYTSNTGLLMRGLSGAIGIPSKSDSIKPGGKDLICTDVPAKAYASKIPNRNLSILEMKALPNMKPVKQTGDYTPGMVERVSSSLGYPALKGAVIGIPSALAGSALLKII